MDTAKGKRTSLLSQLYFQVLLGFVLGIVVGYLCPGFAETLKPLGDGFIKLIKMLLAPIIFGTVVVGIAKMGNLKEVGRVGIKALIYFEIVSTLALAIGLVVVNVMQPGAGMNIDASTLDAKSLTTYTAAAKQQDAVGFFMNIIPASFADAFVQGNMLQIILISVLFGLALAQLPDRGKVIVEVIDSVLHGLFGIVRFVMYLAPLAAFGAMAFTIGKYGVGTLGSFGKLICGVYLTSAIFIFLVLGIIAWMNRISLWKYLKFFKDEIMITFATASSEAVLPRMMVKLEQLGCAKPVVGLVLPAGYTFNADGSSIYLTMGAIFVAQATNTPLTLSDQLIVLAVCLFTSKGSAGVAGAGFIALAATLASMDKIPVAGLVLLVGIDRFVNAARAVTNLIGNGLATIVVARWEKAFDEKRAIAMLNGAANESPTDL
ncbi:MAG: C4-dicarboxylate transporter DctA [Verrucomicrobiota bacterium]|jgi:DAACS family dicarboxylate/amino acid:cation (Na+ or H+) symporter/aerobic C4-dicarboxylate transport protein